MTATRNKVRNWPVEYDDYVFLDNKYLNGDDVDRTAGLLLLRSDDAISAHPRAFSVQPHAFSVYPRAFSVHLQEPNQNWQHPVLSPRSFWMANMTSRSAERPSLGLGP